MKDMFVYYDNDIDKKVVPPQFNVNKKPELLDSEDIISIAHDVFGNEIGIKVKHNVAFNLYLYLDGWVNGASIDTLVFASQLNFKVYDFRHKVILEKQFDAAPYYNAESNWLLVPITLEEAKLLDIDSYKITATLIWDGGDYELYSENDGLLIVR